MRKERLAAAEKVARKLFEAEAALDMAIARAAELNAALPAARREAKLSALLGHDASVSAASVLPALMEAREQLVVTHGNLDQAKTDMGLRQTSWGDDGTKPPQHGDSHLRIVGKAA